MINPVNTATKPIPTFHALGEKAVIMAFGETIDPAIAKLIRQLNDVILENPFPGFITTVPSYTSLCIHYDPIVVVPKNGRLPKSIQQLVIDQLLERFKNLHNDWEKELERVQIPVCYGGTFGPDLDFVAEHHGITAKKVIDVHCAATYLVYMMGFMPGFAYLGGMDKQLATPRKETPRAKVPAGAVGIAGAQTGIYPLESPGGWQLIGRTPQRLFDPNQPNPILLKSGMEIQFVAISEEEFHAYQNNEYGNSHS